MSIERDFHATLAAHAPLTALVATRIAQNAVPGGAAAPLVVYIATHNPTLGLDNTILADQCLLQTQCWGNTAAQADAVADAVQGAIATGLAAAAGAVVLDRASAYDEELGMDGTVLTVEWWAT